MTLWSDSGDDFCTKFCSANLIDSETCGYDHLLFLLCNRQLTLKCHLKKCPWMLSQLFFQIFQNFLGVTVTPSWCQSFIWVSNCWIYQQNFVMFHIQRQIFDSDRRFSAELFNQNVWCWPKFIHVNGAIH